MTGKVGVCLVTSGPAATNLVTALQDAYMDSMPIVALTGQVPTHLIGNDAFQEADNVGITLPCTKHNYLVKDIKDIAPEIREAFHIAATGRPGPVHIDLPKDVLMKQADFEYPESVHLRSYNPTYEGHLGQVTKAAPRSDGNDENVRGAAKVMTVDDRRAVLLKRLDQRLLDLDDAVERRICVRGELNEQRVLRGCSAHIT